MRKENNDIIEAFVPLPLHITLWLSRLLGAAPARLRHARDGWRLSVSPTLAKLQRLIVIVTNVVLPLAIILDFNLEKQDRVRIGQTTLSAAVYITEMCLILLVYNLGVLTAPRQLERTITVLQRIHKIKHSLKERKGLKYNKKTKYVLLMMYITWHIISYSLTYLLTYYQNMHKDILVSTLYSIYGYSTLVLVFVLLHWIMILLEIHSAVTVLNNELDILFQDDAIVPQSQYMDEYIHHLNLSYDAICDMLVQLDKNYGPFLLCRFLLLLMHLLITAYNLIAVILSNQYNDNLERYMSIGIQLNWSCLHLSHLVLFVEPCHWLQEQRERTGRQLNKLVCQAHRLRHGCTYLNPFLLQTQLHDCTLAPCGVFTLTRPLLASTVGGVITYLIIMVQFQAITELI